MWWKSTLSMFLVGAFVYTTFTAGTLIGANAAMNESVSLDNQTNELATVDESVMQELRNDTSGVRERVVLTMAKTPVDMAVGASIYGAELGYDHPGAAKRHAEVAPFFMATALGGYLAVLINRVRNA